jgi:hypothetical protein
MFERKLNTGQIKNEVVLWMVLGPILLIFLFLFGFAIILFAPIFAVYSLISILMFFRTLNSGYLVKSMLFFFLLMFVLFMFFNGFNFFAIVAAVISGILLVWLVALIVVRDHKWRTLQLFELAAMPVDDVEDGYSMRPMPAGKLNYTWDELLSFAGFVRRNLISVIHFQKDRIIFSLERNRSKLISFNSDYISDTWVSFEKNGNVSVHISKKDYMMFRDSYAFDQLCDSLSNTYIEFFKLHQEGKEHEILRKLDFIRV